MKFRLIATVLFFPLSLAIPSLCVGQDKPAPQWKIGAASAKITPDKPMWMAGYASRTKPSDGVELDLHAKALALQDSGGGKFVLITMDLIGIPRDVRLHVAERAEKQYSLPPERLALNASHTHSGPELRVQNAYRMDDPTKRSADMSDYVTWLEDTLIKLIGEALEKAAPADLFYSRAHCGFAMNRRTSDGKGGWRNFPNPNGPVDPDVPVLKATGTDGHIIALLFGYACHCTTLSLQQFNADYAGYAQKAVEEAHPGAVALFANGCSGDQNPYPRRELAFAKTHGQTLATAVEAALGTEMQLLSGTIRPALRVIPLAYDTLPTREQLQEAAKSTVTLDREHAERVLSRLDKEGSLPSDYPYPVQVVRIGDQLTWVGLGGEAVVDYSLRLKKEITDPIVWISGYTNDVPTYIPSLRVWKEGGYEGGDAMKWGFHPTRWSEHTEEHIIGTVHELRKSLK